MKVTIHEDVVLISDGYDIGSIRIENHDTGELIKFLETLKSVPIYYNASEGVIQRTPNEFRKVAGKIGYVRYKDFNNGDAYYFAKGILYKQPALLLQKISSFSPCFRMIFYGDSTVEDLIDSFILQLRSE